MILWFQLSYDLSTMTVSMSTFFLTCFQPGKSVDQRETVFNVSTVLERNFFPSVKDEKGMTEIKFNLHIRFRFRKGSC